MLFRHEVFENRRFRLHGDVTLTGATSNWLLIGLLVIAVGLAAFWVTTSHYARTEQVTGRIVPNGAMTRIVPSRPGVVASLAIHEGDIVKAGQPLATVLVEQASASRADPSGEDLGAVDRQHALLNQQIDLSRHSQGDEVAKLNASIAEAKGEIDSLDHEIEFQRGIVQSAKDSFEPLTAVMNKGFVTRLEFEQKRQQYLAAQSQLAQLQGQRAQAVGQLRQSQAALAATPTQTASRINDLMTNQASLVQKRIEIENSRSYVITAPVSGKVSALQVEQGATVVNQMPMMSIVNDGAVMMAEVYAPSRAIGFARVGQEVRLMYDAFPYQRFGSFPGRITQISHTVLAPNEIVGAVDAKEPVYRVRVAIEQQAIKAFGDKVPLQPGMTLTASIVLDRRSFLDWLLEPINAIRNRT
jgi:membrane fusion protein